MVARIALVVAALAVGGWLAFTLRALWIEDDARALIPAPPAKASTAAVERAEDRLRDAAKGNPDIRPEFTLGYVLYVSGRPRESAAVFADVLRREPQNARAAAALSQALEKSGDAAGAEAATRRQHELAPLLDR